MLFLLRPLFREILLGSIFIDVSQFGRFCLKLFGGVTLLSCSANDERKQSKE
jgi:hypothetical protein